MAAAPVHRALYEPILLAGAPRPAAILVGTLSAALGLGLRAWAAGVLVWLVGHGLCAWLARWDPQFIEVGMRHLRAPAHLEA